MMRVILPAGGRTAQAVRPMRFQSIYLCRAAGPVIRSPETGTKKVGV